MRQFLTLRFWMTIVALVALTGVVYLLTKPDPPSDAVIAAPTAPAERHIDIIAPVTTVTASPDFAVRHGRSTGQLQLVIDATRTMVVQPDTPGEITCANLVDPSQCVVAADLLGDAVLWFALIPGEPRPSVTLPGIVELRDSNVVELANGWVLPRAANVELDCADDVASLTDFVRRFHDAGASTTTYSFDRQQIVRTTCTQAPETTTTAVPATPPAVPVDSTPPDPGAVDTAPNASSSGVG